MKKRSREEIQDFVVLPYLTQRLEEGALLGGPQPPAARWAAKGMGPRPWDTEVIHGGAAASAVRGAGVSAAIDGLNLDLSPQGFSYYEQGTRSADEMTKVIWSDAGSGEMGDPE